MRKPEPLVTTWKGKFRASASRITKREAAYYRQRRVERGEWESLRAAAKAKCDAASDLDELADLTRAYLLADLDLYRHQYNQPEQVAKLLRRANSPAYCRAWAVSELARRLMAEANAAHDMTPDERAAYEGRVKADSDRLARAINAMIGGAR